MGNASKLRIRWVSELIDPSTKTWREDLVRKVFYPPDADTVLQIKLPAFHGEDHLAWHYEKTGLFTVKSAYRLALDVRDKENMIGISKNHAGDRDMWNIIWKTKVLPKVRVFGWKLASNTLGVQALQCARNMNQIATCSICGMDQETNHHAMVECTKAKALRQRLKEAWDLPDDHILKFTGDNWVLVLLSQLNESMRAKLLFLWWRTWHLRNNIIFGDGKVGIEQSAIYLQSYYDAFENRNDDHPVEDAKGKLAISTPVLIHNYKTKEAVGVWIKPRPGWAKVDTDACYSGNECAGSWGAVLRNEEGEVMLSACGTNSSLPKHGISGGDRHAKWLKIDSDLVCSPPPN
jgi:hypothetical protein